jgi:DMSO/TMAO reductase YedYZ molybdopterin-dependent catalytic subunit
MRMLRLSTRATNLTLFALLIPAALSGLGAFMVGGFGGRWVLWIHASVGFTLGLLLVWKQRIIVGSLRRHGFGLWALPSLLLLVLLVTSLLSGALWSTTGLPEVGGISGLTVHAALSIALVFLVMPHARVGWPSTASHTLSDRRALLRTGVLLAVGLALWRGSEVTSVVADFSGSRRRFTGSRAAEADADGDFPANSWLLDDPEPIARARWRLHIGGTVTSPVHLAVGDLVASEAWSVAIDCTGGWYSTQTWGGMPLVALLAKAGPQAGARSIVVRSVTGFSRRFSIDSAKHMLLATQVGGAALSHEHGAPARLVVPGRRGYDWVKWVTSIEVSSLPAWLQWPLPIS